MPHKSYHQILDEHLHILIAQGNHEAYNKLSYRYHRHSLTLVKDLLSKYTFTGVTNRELVLVCEDHFPFVVSKYTPGLSSFFSFWKDSTSKVVIDYLVENSYDGDASIFRGAISFDQKNEEKHPYSELIGERGDEHAIKKRVFEIRYVVNKYDAFFTYQEKALLNLILEGYSLTEVEHSGLLGRSQLSLTYKSLIDKLKKYTKNHH